MEALYRMTENAATNNASHTSATQVGGHGGVMSDASGSIVMKPACTREIAFYQLMASAPLPHHRPPPSNQNSQQASSSSPAAASTESSTTADNDLNPSPPSTPPVPSKYSHLSQRQLLGELRRFLPRFYGTLRLEGQVGKEGGVTPVGETPESIVLQDLSHPYTHPCILDIKLGTKLYDRDASEAKRIRMEARAKECSSWETGMRMTGFQNWDPVKGKMIVTGKPYGYSLNAERLPEGFKRFFPLAHQVQGELGEEATTTATTTTSGSGGEGEPVVAQGAVGVEAGSSRTAKDDQGHTSTPSTPLTPESIERSRRSLIKILHSLHTTILDLTDLLTHLEIELIGSSLLIVYEGDLEALERAWEEVERGRTRGDGLDGLGFGGRVDGDEGEGDSGDEEFGDEDEGGMEGDEIVPGDYVGVTPTTTTTSSSKPGWFAGLIGGFGAEKKDGSTGFGLLDDSPPPSGRRRRMKLPRTRSIASDDDAYSDSYSDDDDDDDGDEDDDDDDDDDDSHPRPFTLRLIDFAHTRLVQGEGPDQGVLKGLREVAGLIKGRLGDLERV